MILLFGITLVFLFFTFIPTRKFNAIIKISLMLLMAILATTAFFIFGVTPPTRLPDKNWYEITPWKHIILFVSMLFGMVSNYLLEYFQARIKAKESKGKIKMPKFIWEKIALPLLIAVLVFGYFWEQYGKEVMSIAVLLISFQNGFFWQTVLEKVRG